MRERILNDLKQAMKDQNKDVLAVIRMVKGAIQMEELKVKHELSDDEVITIITREIKTRKESIQEFEKGNRSDLASKTAAEIMVLEKYLPEQLTEEEIDQIIDEAFEIVQPVAPSDMGKIMAVVTPKVKGKADMKLVSTKIKGRL